MEPEESEEFLKMQKKLLVNPFNPFLPKINANNQIKNKEKMQL